MATTTNEGQGEGKSIEGKELDEKSIKNQKRIRTCLNSLRGMSIYEAERFIFSLADHLKKGTKVV